MIKPVSDDAAAMLSPIIGLRFEALLFDMDGTILTSIKAAERVWTAWAVRHGLDVATFLPTIHGVQATETIRRLGLAGVDPEVEAATITQGEVDDVEGVEPISGVREFLSSLPQERWAVVTSSPRRLALRRLEAAGLPIPKVLVCAEDVERGKPAPDCFLLAAERLGADIRFCAAFEDSPAGIASAHQAGSHLVIVTTTHSHPMETQHASVRDYSELRASTDQLGRLTLGPPGHFADETGASPRLQS